MIFRKGHSTERVPWDLGGIGTMRLCNTIDLLLAEGYVPIGFEVLPNDEQVVFEELGPRFLKPKQSRFLRITNQRAAVF
jgi:hypothetical protein